MEISQLFGKAVEILEPVFETRKKYQFKFERVKEELLGIHIVSDQGHSVHLIQMPFSCFDLGYIIGAEMHTEVNPRFNKRYRKLFCQEMTEDEYLQLYNHDRKFWGYNSLGHILGSICGLHFISTNFDNSDLDLNLCRTIRHNESESITKIRKLDFVVAMRYYGITGEEGIKTLSKMNVRDGIRSIRGTLLDNLVWSEPIEV